MTTAALIAPFALFTPTPQPQESSVPELTRAEFELWMRALREDVKAGEGRLQASISGVHERLDELNGRTRTNELKVAVIEDRQNRQDSSARVSAAKWGSGAGAAIAGALGVLWKLLAGSGGPN